MLCKNNHVSLRVYLLAVSRMASAFGEILATLAAVDTDLIQIYVGMFGARFPRLREGRPWVFEMAIGGLAAAEFRTLLGNALIFSTAFIWHFCLLHFVSHELLRGRRPCNCLFALPWMLESFTIGSMGSAFFILLHACTRNLHVLLFWKSWPPFFL